MIGMCLCSKPRLSWKLFSTPTINNKFIRFESRYNTNNGTKDSCDLPWLQQREDIFKKEPIFHRFHGRLFLRTALKYTRQSQVRWADFSKGASEAVKRIVQCISSHDNNNELQNFIGPALLVQYKTAFKRLEFRNKKIHLDVEGPVRMHISGARIIIGEVEPGDELVCNMFGQKLIISQSELKEMTRKVFETRSVGLLFKGPTYLVFSALGNFKAWRFQYDVKFELYERFCILDAGNNVQSNEEEIDPVHSYHRWRFETKLFPRNVGLDWNVVDVDDFLKNKFMLPEESENQP